ncbi:hypothetical protein LTR86_008165 [Recurvomyces mirabilis]|nr:hypothetical protein LTR86_008165 [Recurvomyces mirabilis]
MTTYIVLGQDRPVATGPSSDIPLVLPPPLKYLRSITAKSGSSIEDVAASLEEESASSTGRKTTYVVLGADQAVAVLSTEETPLELTTPPLKYLRKLKSRLSSRNSEREDPSATEKSPLLRQPHRYQQLDELASIIRIVDSALARCIGLWWSHLQSWSRLKRNQLLDYGFHAGWETNSGGRFGECVSDAKHCHDIAVKDV